MENWAKMDREASKSQILMFKLLAVNYFRKKAPS